MNVDTPVSFRASRRRTAHSVRVRLAVMVLAADLISLVLAFLFARLLRDTPDSWYAIPAVVMSIYAGTAFNAGAYSLVALREPSRGRSAALRSLVFAFGALFLIIYFFRIDQSLSRIVLLATMGLSALRVSGSRSLLCRLVKRRWATQLVSEMFIRTSDDVPALPPHVMQGDAARLGIAPDLRDPAMMDRFAALVRGIDRVIIGATADTRRAWAMMLKGANILGEVLVDDLGDIGAFGLARLGAHHTLTVSSGPLNLEQRIVKRTFDLALCVPILLALAPLLLATSLAIKLDSRGPVFFRQRRVGRGNAFFEVLKFRSMRNELCDADGRQSTRRDDERITRVGFFIRRTSVDELPQLLNVLGGSMSLVGPRPHALGSMAGEQLFWDVDERYWHRHALKPGITGLAQIRGFRGATHQQSDLANRLQADLEYAADWSVWRDVGILLSTFRVLVHENTY